MTTITNIRKVDNVANMYVATVDGVEMEIATRAGQDPVEVINELFGEFLPNYKEQRLQEYPSINEQLDMIYHDIDAWREKIAAIKSKYPKA